MVKKVVKEPFTQPVGTVASNGITGAARGGGFRPTQGIGANGQPQPGPEQPAVDPNRDPQTKVDMSADTRVTIRRMVVLDPPIPPPDRYGTPSELNRGRIHPPFLADNEVATVWKSSRKT